MRNYIKMKKNEWRIKAAVYGAIAALIDNQKELLSMLQKMYVALKDVPAEELQKEFISRLAEIIHEEGKDKTE
ncbi:MAG: hypothetical protein K2O32_05925 [Acetatifactor sp.]|nr:hypothetical protein [Acetatifactor sp.]